MVRSKQESSHQASFHSLLTLSHCTQKTKVLLNLYDYTFGSGGGVFDHAPREAPGARFRKQIDMGTYDGGSKELTQALDDLRSTFGPSDYDLVRKNCNHFSNALCWALMRKPLPGYVNRLADIGNCCSCLLPKKITQDSPVGDNNGSGGNSFLVPTQASMNRGKSNNSSTNSSFTGRGQSLGGNSESSSFLSTWSQPNHAKQPKDDLTDRRERARKAALARLEKQQQNQLD